MVLNIILAVIFFGSVGALWYAVSQKIPRLVSIPDEAIMGHLHERSANVRLFLLNFGTFWRERKFQKSFWRGLVKFLHRIHILLLQIDNGLVAIVKKIRLHAGVNGINGDADTRAPRARTRVVHEIRLKRKRSDFETR